MLLPAHTSQKAIGNSFVRHLGDDSVRFLDSCHFIQNQTRPAECLVSRTERRNCVFEREKIAVTKWLVVVHQTMVFFLSTMMPTPEPLGFRCGNQLWPWSKVDRRELTFCNLNDTVSPGANG